MLAKWSVLVEQQDADSRARSAASEGPVDHETIPAGRLNRQVVVLQHNSKSVGGSDRLLQRMGSLYQPRLP